MSQEASAHFLELGKSPVRFDPVSAVTNVFFDEANKQVFAVRSGGETGVVVKGPTDRAAFTFRLKDRGPLISIKFSYQHKVLALQRNDRSVHRMPSKPMAKRVQPLMQEFSNFEDGTTDPIEYSQTCKGRNNAIRAFHWVSHNEVLFSTETGVEYYQLNTEKRFLKLIKNHALTIHWSVFSPEASVLLAASGNGNLLVPFYIRSGQVARLQKFEVDASRTPGSKLKECDVFLLSLYNTLYTGVLRHPSPNTNEKCQLDLYLLNKDAPVRKSFVLQLGLVGRFAFNIVDNLVVAHHQVSKTSMIFDIKLPGISRSNVVRLDPLVLPLPIRPFLLRTQLPKFGIQSGNTVEEAECDMYAQTWIVFRPNIVIDAALGCMWYLKMNLFGIIDMFQDQCLLLDFLLLRRSSKSTILEVFKEALHVQAPLSQTSSFFSKLNQVYKDYIEAEQFYQHKVEAQPDVNHIPHHRTWVVLDQNDIFTQVLQPFVDGCDVTYQYKVSVLTEYLKSLDSFKIKPKHFLSELLINTLVHGGGHFHLQQLLRHKIIEDSQPVACLLLSLESTHPPCFQLALDMLKRLATSDEQVIEVMLSKKMILPALRFIRQVGMLDLVPPRKFLAASTHDDMLFFSVYKTFESRNIRVNGKAEFPAAERCHEFTERFVRLFVADALR